LIESILYFGILPENLGLFRFVSVCFGLFWFVLEQFVSVDSLLQNTKTESFDVSIEPKQTEDQPKQFDREHILLFFNNLGLFRFVLKQFCLFQFFKYRFETPKQTKTNRKKAKHNQNRSCFGLFRFEQFFF
jgi:hypothetical protein